MFLYSDSILPVVLQTSEGFFCLFSIYLPCSQAPAWECILPNNNLNSIKNHLKPCIKIIPITRITPVGIMRQKIQYIHDNPVKHGYVDLSEHWRYSSYRNYFDTGLEVVFDGIEVVVW
jgi:hypothetical protein